jgi:hypothetical protein
MVIIRLQILGQNFSGILTTAYQARLVPCSPFVSTSVEGSVVRKLATLRGPWVCLPIRDLSTTFFTTHEPLKILFRSSLDERFVENIFGVICDFTLDRRRPR